MQAVSSAPRKNRYINIRKSLIGAALLCVVYAFFIRPSFSVSFRFHNVVGTGIFQCFQTNEYMREYYHQEISVDEDSTLFTAANYPIHMDTIRFDLSGVQELTLDEIDVALWGVQLKTFYPAELYASKAWHSGMSKELVPDGLRLSLSAESACMYLDAYLFMGIKGTLLYLGLPFLLFFSLCLLYNAKCKKRFAIRNYRRVALLIFVPAVNLLLGEFTTQALSRMDFLSLVHNYLLLLGIFSILYYIPCFVGVALGSIVLQCGYIANHYMIALRYRPLIPQDLSAVNTALSVIDRYRFDVTPAVALSILWLVLLVPILWWVKKKEPKPRFEGMGFLTAFACVWLAWGHGQLQRCKISYWDSDTVYFYEKQGFLTSFIRYWQLNRVAAPEGYSTDMLKNEVLSRYPTDEADGVQPQNIIMVMHESLMDVPLPESAGQTDTLSFFHSLTENTIRGNLYVSVRGGSTCNTEFESLTGNSLLFLPRGCIPFQTQIKRNTFSLASYFKKAGYTATGLHFASERNWNRANVYPRLGFDRFLALPDFESSTLEFLRGNVTDQSNFRQLTALDDPDGKDFIFNVTIENHGGYSPTAELPQAVDLSALGSYPAAECYYSLLKLSDEAMRELIEHYQACDEPTMIVIYGDHQPALGTAADNLLFAGDDDPLRFYRTPFLIWTNYTIESRTIERMSANCLPALILETGNFPLPPYWQLVQEVYEKYPVLTLQGYVDSAGAYHADIQDCMDDPLIRLYQCAQYNALFGRPQLSALFEAGTVR